MVTIKGMSLKFPESTTLALACAAMRIATEGKLSKRTSMKYREKSREYLEDLGGIGASEPEVSPQRAAVELLRSNLEAREEAKAAIEKVYGRRGVPRMGWIVHVLGAPRSFVAPVDLLHPEGKFV